MLVAKDVRHILFLQGPGNKFFYQLSQQLEKLGLRTSKIHLCIGDRLFWGKGETVDYKGSLDHWSDYIASYINDENVTDLILFSDIRPYHAKAVKVAKSMGINIHVFENGYFRPYWITMQQGGVNGRSTFPATRKGVEELARKTGCVYEEPSFSMPPSRLQYVGDTVFHGINYWLSFLYPKYVPYRVAHPIRESIGWWKRLFQRRRKVAESKQVLDRLIGSKQKFFLFPLQLDHDFQLLEDSPFNSISQATDSIIKSFAENAPADTALLVKNHPLDNNITDRQKDTMRIARKYDIADRVLFIETGHNPTILHACMGMVTINSTMGSSALVAGIPLKVLGKAVYDMEGLSNSCTLDEFWSNPVKPDPDFFNTFRACLISQSQIAGSFRDNKPDSFTLTKCVIKICSTTFSHPGETVDFTPDNHMSQKKLPLK